MGPCGANERLPPTARARGQPVAAENEQRDQGGGGEDVGDSPAPPGCEEPWIRHQNVLRTDEQRAGEERAAEEVRSASVPPASIGPLIRSRFPTGRDVRRVRARTPALQ